MEVKLREVTPHDWQFILDIRNDEEVRMACHDTSIIDFETHAKYMENLSRDTNSHQWIVVCDNKDVGHTKIVNGEFGYMLKKEFRGKGIGKKIYELVFEEARKMRLDLVHITIKVDQPVPLRVAQKVGFVQTGLTFKDGKPYAYTLEKNLRT
jgi:RimJ/RimL family protein N-acetyltransferase